MGSPGFRFVIVGFLALLMFIPLFFAGTIIKERAGYSRLTAQELGQEWGGPQVLSGPELRIPVTETVTTKEREEIIDPVTGEPRLDRFGRVQTQLVERTEELSRDAIYVLPDRFDVQLEAESDIRKRGIFEVPVYRSEVATTFDYDLSEIALGDAFTIHWERAQLRFALTSNRALRGSTVLKMAGTDLRLSPWARDAFGGVVADIGDPRPHGAYDFRLGLQGTERLTIAPVGRTSTVHMVSDWAHPSFVGAFLPDRSETSDAGFSAEWTVPHLARALPQVARSSQLALAEKSAFGVRFFQPNDFYQKAYRAARYGILFIALTFLLVLLIERGAERPTHPVQYVLIGLVQAMFVVLMVAYAEQIGFGAAYLLASVAVVGLLTLYGAVALKLGQRTLILGAMLATLYGLLFLILRSADYALLAGATLIFAALAGTMFGTRNEEWYGPDGPRQSLLRKKAAPSGESSL